MVIKLPSIAGLIAWLVSSCSGTPSRVIETLGMILGARDIAEGRSEDLAGVEVVD